VSVLCHVAGTQLTLVQQHNRLFHDWICQIIIKKLGSGVLHFLLVIINSPFNYRWQVQGPVY
jgi:hypothetical protein